MLADDFIQSDVQQLHTRIIQEQLRVGYCSQGCLQLTCREARLNPVSFGRDLNPGCDERSAVSLSSHLHCFSSVQLLVGSVGRRAIRPTGPTVPTAPLHHVQTQPEAPLAPP